jgi:glutaredoxin-related protein
MDTTIAKKQTLFLVTRLFLSSAIDSGVGLTVGKMMCGKSIAQTDETYLTTVKLEERFKQLKRFLRITEQPKVESDDVPAGETIGINIYLLNSIRIALEGN